VRASKNACERDIDELSENRGEAITLIEKRRDRFVSMEALLSVDTAPREPPDITRTTNLKLYDSPAIFVFPRDDNGTSDVRIWESRNAV